ncbi:hypothetical protein [Methylomicrobium lacus]|uniref:hypothetical protein n=1 Tax=Methylomicrobium lacus TaxID=136992 RepID=UPI0035A99D42
MKNLFALCVLFGTAIGFVRGDPNIYGPGGVNLGPNGELPPSRQEVEQKKLLDAEREKTRLLQEQVEQQQQQLQQLKQMQQQQQQQQEMQWSRQNPVQIDIHQGYPPQQNFGWMWGGPFLGSGSGGILIQRKSHGGGDHHGGGGRDRH